MAGARRAQGSTEPSSTLSPDVAVVLAHALVGAAAAAAGTRALVIKGPAAGIMRLRSERSSADVDVLVPVRDHEAFCAALRARGWHALRFREPPRILADHSLTLTHDEWPCAIDVHHYFPGFLGDADEVFEALWASRVSIGFAHRSVSAPSRAGSAVILALHALRTPTEGRAGRDLDDLQQVLYETFDGDERAELLRIARIGRAQWTLGPLLDGLGWARDDDADPEEQRIWAENQRDPRLKSASLWGEEIRSALRGGRLGRVIRAFWVRRADMPSALEHERPTIRAHWAYQIERWRRGIDALRSARAERRRG